MRVKAVAIKARSLAVTYARLIYETARYAAHLARNGIRKIMGKSTQGI